MNIFARKQKSISLKLTWWFLSFEAENGWIIYANLSFPAGSLTFPFTWPQTRSCDIHQACWDTMEWCWHGWHPAASCSCFGTERACRHPVEGCAESWFQGFPRPTSGPTLKWAITSVSDWAVTRPRVYTFSFTSSVLLLTSSAGLFEEKDIRNTWDLRLRGIPFQITCVANWLSGGQMYSMCQYFTCNMCCSLPLIMQMSFFYPQEIQL